MKYRMKFTLPVYVLTGIVAALTLGSMVINILILAKVGNFAAGGEAVAAVSLCCSLILFGLCMALIFNSRYVFREDALRVVFGVFFVTFPYKKILAVATEKLTKKTYIQYSVDSKKRDFDVLAINVDPSKNEAFIKDLTDKNPDIFIGDDNPSSDETVG